MDRQIVYIGQIPQDTDLLLQNRNTMIGLGYALQAVLGTGTVVDGLACTPTGPATLTVNVGPGAIYSQQNVDGTAYGSLSADTGDQIIKQGIVLTTTNLSCPAPGTVGQSINYLIEAAYQDQDTGSTVLPYYNSSNPSVAWSGPNNTGVSQNTVRKGVCLVQVKAGTAATTGTQTTPAADAGFTGLYVVTVANGQSTITSGNITQLSTAPFISPKLGGISAAIQGGQNNYAADTSGAANTIAIALSPVPGSLTAGMRVWVKVANTNTGAIVINTNGLGNVSAIMQDGTAIPAGRTVANGVYQFAFDGSNWQLQANTGRVQLQANTTFYVATTGSDSNLGTSGSPWLTIQHAINYVANTIDLNGFNVTISVADGTYTSAVSVSAPWVGSGTVTLQGDTGTPANCIISVTSNTCIQVSGYGSSLSVEGFKLTTATSGHAISAVTGGTITIAGSMNFGAVSGSLSNQINVGSGGLIIVNSNYTISGGNSGGAHIQIFQSGQVLYTTGLTITLSGTPAFADFAVVSGPGTLQISSETFSGSATGTRYVVNQNGVINTTGGGSTYLPGNVAGSTATGGQYI